MSLHLPLPTPAVTDLGADGPSAPWVPWCEVHETHSGGVLLLGDRAFKFKKPVDLGFLDFRERDQRRQVCEREVELNRRLAPDEYLGVGDLVDPDGVSEPVVVMRRQREQYRLSHLIRSGVDVTREVGEIARAVAGFHARAETGPAIDVDGSLEALRRRWQANLDETTEHSGRFLDPSTFDEISSLAHGYLRERDGLFDDRVARGAIVDGHGDLTPDDIFCLPDGPRLLDCLEFDDTLRHVDRLDDVAFLAMGLEVLGSTAEARLLVSTWAEYLDDPAPPSLVHHFIAYRAFVRAKVECLRAAQLGASHSPEADAYAGLALSHLRAGAVRLVLVGGSPGSGKSTLAGAVADRLGMVVVSSDRVRKEMAGIDPMTSASAPVGHGIYDRAHTQAAYAEILRRAELLIRRGESVVLDASWTLEADRRDARAVASTLGVELVELRCEVDPDTAVSRIRGRRDVSDADADVATSLRGAAEPWPSSHRIDTGESVDDCAVRAVTFIRPFARPDV